MEKGSYLGRHVSLVGMASPRFHATLYTSYGKVFPCGAAALALITGSDPNAIAKYHRSPHYSDQFMMRYLRQRGYTVVHITQCLVSRKKDPIRPDHVVLMSQLIRRNEATWCVMYGDICWHNFTSYATDSLTYLNKPIMSAFVVWHARNNIHPRILLKPAPPVKTSKDVLTMAKLRGVDITELRKRIVAEDVAQ